MLQKARRKLKKARNKLKRRYRRSPLFRLLNPRRTHLYCVGTAKSGTHSIQAIFSGQLRSAHEAESRQVIDMVLGVASRTVSDGALRDYVKRRNRRMWLEIDSSQLNYFLLDALVALYPDAKFVLTIRNPYAWLDSFINHQLAREASKRWWGRLRDLRFRPNEFDHTPEEAALKEKGLYTLDGYLSYWTRHNRKVLEAVPDDRLLVVRTDRITERTEDIAELAGVTVRKADRERSHAFKGKVKYNVLDAVDRGYLERKIEEYCGALMNAYFPDIRTAEAGLPSLSRSSTAPPS